MDKTNTLEAYARFWGRRKNTQMFILETLGALLLSLGTFCVLWWIPLPITGSPNFRAPSELSRLDYALGTIGTLGYLCQVTRLLIFGADFPAHAPSGLVALMYAVMALAVILFGACVLNFLRVVVLRPQHGWKKSG